MSDVMELDVTPVDGGVAGVLHKSELDQQITMAHRYPRSLTKFKRDAESMIKLSEDVAGDCIFALPRGGKTIEGPSVRLAEIVVNTWGNCRAGARIIDENAKEVVAQGFFIDLERNTAIYREVSRRITGNKGRYSEDMITMTKNAAASIAMRNAIMVGVPRAVWWELYLMARQVVAGDAETLPNRRTKALELLQKVGVPVDRIVKFLGLHAAEDITVDHLVTLRGLYCAIRDGEATPEDAFQVVDDTPKAEPQARGVAALASVLTKPEPPPTETVPVPAPANLTGEPEVLAGPPPETPREPVQEPVGRKNTGRR